MKVAVQKWQNESTTDRVIRLLFGLSAFLSGFYADGTAQIIWWVIAAILLLTGITGYCLLYTLFGVSTKEK